MDFLSMFAALWFVIPLLIIGVVIKSPRFKGWVGELMVKVAIKWQLDQTQYQLINNVTLPTDNGTTQIDHIIVSVFGVFVVETKNMKGWIYGSEKQKTWTQKIYQYSSQFQNPLHQNYKHVKTLQALLGLRDDQVYSVVVFVGNSTFKTKMPEHVTHGAGLIRYIKSKHQPVFTQNDIKQISQNIQQGRLTPSMKTNREHVKHVQQILAEKTRVDVETPACPTCGGLMVRRESKKGANVGKAFWGCQKFPQCRGMSNL